MSYESNIILPGPGMSNGAPSTGSGGSPTTCPSTWNYLYRFYGVGSATSFDIKALISNGSVTVTVAGVGFTIVSVDVYSGLSKKVCTCAATTAAFAVVKDTTYKVTAYLNIPSGGTIPVNGSLTLTTNPAGVFSP